MSFRLGDCEGYVIVGEYENGRPGELFLKVSKQGSTLSGIMDAFAIAVSLGLQHGVPLASFVRKYINMGFEPAGMTDDKEIRIAKSLVDYIFRRLALEYLSFEERLDLGVLSTSERIQGDDGAYAPVVPAPGPAAPIERAHAVHHDAPFCFSCGNVMVRAGSCYACPSCGSTSGCS
jgi:ribonucleoside-diphosphate reductase alpha chain